VNVAFSFTTDSFSNTFNVSLILNVTLPPSAPITFTTITVSFPYVTFVASITIGGFNLLTLNRDEFEVNLYFASSNKTVMLYTSTSKFERGMVTVPLLISKICL